jgi:predicted  nucleic acid-binding Zn-ribbon protein
MNSDLIQLIELQQVEKEIARLRAEIAALPKHVQAIERKLADANQRVAKAQAAIKADEVARRKHESDIQGHNERISKLREQSLAVKTNDQYRALMHEIGFAEKEIRKLEDKILETMIDADAKQQDLKKAQQDLKEESATIEKEKAHAHAKTAEAEAQLGGHTAHQKKLRSGVDPELLEHYDRLTRARGTALAEAREQRCTACQVLLRPQVFNEVRMDTQTAVYCDSCSRILYYDPTHTPEVMPVVDAKPAPVKHAWFYVEQDGQGRFLAATNSKSGCSLRIYDAQNGRSLERRSEKGRVYQEAFATLLHEARNLFVHDPRLVEESKDQLPSDALLDLQRQLPS